MVDRRFISSNAAPAPVGGYSQAVEINGARRVVYVSGQIPTALDGTVPESFPEQARLVWRNIEAQLRAADMSLEDLVKITTFLSDRKFADENGAIRREVLGKHAPALTVLIASIFDPAWLLEVEAIALA